MVKKRRTRELVGTCYMVALNHGPWQRSPLGLQMASELAIMKRGHSPSLEGPRGLGQGHRAYKNGTRLDRVGLVDTWSRPVNAQERPGQHTNRLLARGHDQVQCVEKAVRLAEGFFGHAYSPMTAAPVHRHDRVSGPGRSDEVEEGQRPPLHGYGMITTGGGDIRGPRY